MKSKWNREHTVPSGTVFFIREDERFPDSVHNWVLRENQYTLGYLNCSEQEALWIAQALENTRKANEGIG